MTVTQQNSFYNHFSKNTPTRLGNWLTFHISRQIFKFARIKKGSTLLEIGPGRGSFAKVCAENNIDYWAIEPNTDMAAKLENITSKVIRAKVPPLPDIKQKFDTVVMINVIEHIDSMSKALELSQQIYQTLKPGGKFLLGAPDYVNWGEYFFYCDFSHNYITTLRRLRSLLISAGFENIQTEYKSGPFKNSLAILISAISRRMPFCLLNAIFPQSKTIEKLNKLQVTFLRTVNICAEKNEANKNDH